MHVCIALCFILADRRNRWRLTRETRFHLFIPNLGIDIVWFLRSYPDETSTGEFLRQKYRNILFTKLQMSHNDGGRLRDVTSVLRFSLFSRDCIPFIDWLEWCAGSFVVMYGHYQGSRAVFNFAGLATRPKAEANVSRFGIGSCWWHFL